MHPNLKDVSIDGFNHKIIEKDDGVNIQYETHHEGERFGFMIRFTNKGLSHPTFGREEVRRKMDRARYYGREMLEKLNAS